MVFELKMKAVIFCNGTHGTQHKGTRRPPKLKRNEIMEEPRPYVDDILRSNSGGNIATVKRRANDAIGFAIVLTHNNQLLNTREYAVE